MKHYLNNAGAGTMSQQTLDVIIRHLKREIEIGAYVAAQENKENIAKFYDAVKQCIHADRADEIAFMDSASRGLNMVVYGLQLKEGDTIVTLSTEFGTNLLALYDYAKRAKLNLKIIQCDTQGKFDIVEIKKSLEKGAKALYISQATAQGSIVNPVCKIGKLAKEYNAIYIVDGCQAVGQMPVNVNEMHCHAYITTGRKWLRGPRGTGFLYVRENTPIQATQVDLASADLDIDFERNDIKGIVIRKDARRFELWERSVASVLGLSEAINEYLKEDQKKIHSLIYQKANSIRKGVALNSAIQIIGEAEATTGIVGFYLKNKELEDVLRRNLMEASIGFSAMSDWDCPLGFPKCASTIFRLSPHFYTSDETIDKAIEVISQLN